MKSSWLRYPPVVLFSLRKEVSSYLLQFPTLSVTFTGGDLTWLPDTDACMIPVLLFTLQLSSTRTGGGPRAVTAHAVVPTMGYKIYVAIGTIKSLKDFIFLCGHGTQHLDTGDKMWTVWKIGGSCPVWTYGFLILLLQVTHLPLLHLETLKYLNLGYRLYQLRFSSLRYTETLNMDLHFSNIFLCHLSHSHSVVIYVFYALFSQLIFTFPHAGYLWQETFIL